MGTRESLLGISGDESLRAGQAVGGYVVEGPCGRGGFGSVVRASHPIIGKAVAIKVLDRRYSVDAGAVARFVAEARAANAIGSDHIVDVFAFGTLDDGRHYHVMEYLEGETLAQLLERRGRLEIGEAMPLLRGIARGLAAAHARGIVHRDLKPHNVFVTERDGAPFVKLIDFGLAKLLPSGDMDAEAVTASGALLGTPEYMAPEQCRGRTVDARTDVYAFGVLAYRTLTGRLPFTGDDPLEIMIKHTSEAPPPPSRACPELDRRLDRPLLHLLEKDPARRPREIDGALSLLEAARTARPARRARLAAIAAAVALAAAAVALATRGGGNSGTPAPDPAAAGPDRATAPPPAAATRPGGDVAPSAADTAHGTPATTSDSPAERSRRRSARAAPDPEDIEDPFQ